MAKNKYGIEQPILDKIISIIAARKNVDIIYLFGSRAENDYKDTSDIDIAVSSAAWTSSDINIVKNKLEEQIKTPLKFDVLCINLLGKKTLKENILKQGKVIYDSGKDKRTFK
ncbi:MAG: nucleotidyltransferase domain-containing protein [Candidatus Omnitrophota bacterium]